VASEELFAAFISNNRQRFINVFNVYYLTQSHFEIMSIHTTFLSRCNELAQLAKTEGESAVGSVIVLDGIIIGEGSEKSRQQHDVTRHAEVVAILDAVAKNGNCKGATLYTNVEPCMLCSYVIRHHQIATVVFSKHSGELGGTNPLFNLLTTDKITKWTKAPEVIVERLDS
jgi:tRNA(Arg) A34 adenosine deaminase TadA